jgi:hypothetical protein
MERLGLDDKTRRAGRRQTGQEATTVLEGLQPLAFQQIPSP